MNERCIVLSKNCHGNLGCTLYNINGTSIWNWFSMLDVWGGHGYDRFEDGGIHFEIPYCMYDVLEELPIIHYNRIKVIKQ